MGVGLFLVVLTDPRRCEDGRRFRRPAAKPLVAHRKEPSRSSRRRVATHAVKTPILRFDWRVGHGSR
jgi:hypothetical protein